MADALNFDKQMTAQNVEDMEIAWCSVPSPEICVEGLGFFEKEQKWNRLPSKSLPQIKTERPELEELSAHLAGASLRFQTNSRAVWIRAVLDSAPYMAHMTPAAQCGCDCYLRVLPDQNWHFAGLTKFSPHDDHFCCLLAQDLPMNTEVQINLPLYIGIRSIQIGLEKRAELWPASPRKHQRRIAFYGTSITQGGCASRPGMAYPAILSREMDREVYNFGFSGNGVGMASLADCFCALPNLGALVVDIQPNAGPEGVLKTNLSDFLDAVRSKMPHLPILVLSASWQTKCSWNSAEARKFAEDEQFQQLETEKRRSNGDRLIWYESARKLLKEVEEEATVDGVHLTDLGFWALAKGLKKCLNQILNEKQV